MSDLSNPAYRDGWMDAIKAVNEEAAPGMADAMREARVQALRDAARDIESDRRDTPAEWLNRRANDIEKGQT